MTSHRLAATAALAATMVLAGCVADPAQPQAATEIEVRSSIALQNASWWSSMFPDEPMPRVQVIDTVDAEAQSRIVDGCLAASGLPVQRDPSANSQPDYLAFERALWFCYQQYPVHTEEIIAQGFLSRDQLSYLYDYYVQRLVPCLVMLGFRVEAIPDRGSFMGFSLGYPTWTPFDRLEPQPRDQRAWDSVISQCPPPPFARFIAQQWYTRH